MTDPIHSFTDAQIAGLAPVVPRMLGYQPHSVSLTAVGADLHIVANAHLPQPVADVTVADIHHTLHLIDQQRPDWLPQPVAAVALAWTDRDDVVDRLAFDLAEARVTPLPITAAQVNGDHWRRPANAAAAWQAVDPYSATMAAVTFAGYGPAPGDRDAAVARWRPDPALQAAVAPFTGRDWAAHTVADRRRMVDRVWSTVRTAFGQPLDDRNADILGLVIAAANTHPWMRDTIMLRACHAWRDVEDVLAAAVRAASLGQVAGIGSLAAAAAFYNGQDMPGREALIRAVNDNRDQRHTLTNLLDRAYGTDVGMTRIVRSVLDGLTETRTLAAGLPG